MIITNTMHIILLIKKKKLIRSGFLSLPLTLTSAEMKSVVHFCIVDNYVVFDRMSTVDDCVRVIQSPTVHYELWKLAR